ncbi:hypothetical protein D6745_03205 [Candidatus Woesearchaeota archaeon]|nr:MAG: hypothetical protein D6745_03205 [Candidatus Woesearchaeota archaeon]
MKLNASQIISKAKKLKQERAVWESHWQDLADYILPRKNDIITRNKVKGRKKGEFLFDNTGMVACELLAGALHGLLTSPNQVWFDLTTGDRLLDNDPEVLSFLQDLRDQMHMILNNSNFQTEIHEVYLDLVCFGTAVMVILEDEDKIVRFSAKSLADVYVEENNLGIIESAYRTFRWDARTIVQEFAKGVDESDEAKLEELVGKEVLRCFKKGDKKKFEIIHAVYREDLTKNKVKPFISQYILVDTKKVLKEDGFRTFPYVVPRWTKVSGEIYGRGPGMNALPEVKTVNAMTKAVLKAAQKTVDPPLQMPDDGFVSPKINKPGSISYYRAGSRDRIEPIFPNLRVDVGIELTRDRQARIREAFFVDQLQLNRGPQMTATEVNARTEERMRLLGPLLGRQQNELLRPLIDRLLDIMIARDLVNVDNVPPALQGQKLNVVYSSPIARAQRIDQGQSLLRAFQASAPFLQLDQSAVDNIDVDAVIKETWKIYGAPQNVLRTEDEIDNIRKQRAEAQQQMIEKAQATQETQQAIEAAKATGISQATG